MVLDNLSEGHEEMVLTDNFVEGDLSNDDLLEDVFSSYSFDAVLHFAAHCKVGESVQDPLKYYRNNVMKGITLIEVMLDNGVENLVFSSSAAVYGDPEEIPIPENHPKAPKNPYGQTKLMLERILGDFTSAYPLRAISLRYFNAAGSDPEGEIGEWHTPETHLIPLVLDAASGRRENIEIYGTDYPTSDGTCIRDFVHVSDLATAHIRAVDSLLGTEDYGSWAFNLGAGRGHSVREVIQMVRSVTGKQFEVVEGDRRPGDPARLVADPRKARQELGWKPRFSNLEDIVRTAWDWHSRVDE